jgi:putative ABC transport system permease protein
MNLFVLVWSYVRSKPLNTLLNILLVGLGIGVITVLILFKNQLGEKIGNTSKGVDLVVGAKGSPLQLILCNLFHIDFPTGNIKLADAEKLVNHRLVKNAVPLALGPAYTAIYSAQLGEGKWWTNDLEVTVGAAVAEALKLKLGAHFASSHGLSKEGHAHEEAEYKVVGILKPTGSVIDNLILTNVASIWKVHEESGDSIVMASRFSKLLQANVANDSTREITSLLIKYKNPMAAIQLPRMINSQTNMQAASPAFETARLYSIMGVGTDVLMGFAYVLIFISGLSIFIALYNSLKERQYDLAIMRSMGASRAKLVWSVIMEGITLTLFGALLGLALGHLVLWVFTTWIPEGAKGGFTGAVWYAEELLVLLGSLLLGVLCSLLPAWRAYRTDIHQVLAGG